MDPPPAGRAASKRRNRRRRRRAAAPDAATEASSDVLAAERGGDAQGNAAAAASSSSSRRRDRRRRRRRDRGAKVLAAALKSPEAHVSDVVSIQGGSSKQSDCCLESVLAHSTVSLPQTTTKKIVNTNETQERNENENGASINYSILKEEKKKRKKRKGRKRHDGCEKTTSQDCPLSNGADDSGLLVKISEENTSCLPMMNSDSVYDAKTKEQESVNLDSTITERNKLQEQDVACSENDSTVCLSPSNLAEAYAEKLQVVFSQGRSFIGAPKKKTTYPRS